MKNELGIKVVTSLFCITLSSLFVIPTVSAHVLQTDGTIGAVMHINPSDDPRAGSKSTFFFEFKDRANAFILSDCQCKVRISGNTPIYETTFGSEPFFTYTIPDMGVYTVTINGTSVSGKFKPFTLSYIIRVDKQATNSSQSHVRSFSDHFIHYGIFGLGFLVLILLVIREKKKHRES